jgi:hypothetical protein
MNRREHLTCVLGAFLAPVISKAPEPMPMPQGRIRGLARPTTEIDAFNFFTYYNARLVQTFDGCAQKFIYCWQVGPWVSTIWTETPVDDIMQFYRVYGVPMAQSMWDALRKEERERRPATD